MTSTRTPGPLLGAHLSISSGLSAAISTAQKLGCEAVQIHTKSNRQWGARPISTEEAASFQEAWGASPVAVVFAHAAYLINICSPKDELYRKSIEGLTEEIKRCELLGLPYLVLHPGTPQGAHEGAPRRAAEAVDRAFKYSGTREPRILLETMAGRGEGAMKDTLFFKEIMKRSRYRARLGVCADTCHLFAAGYDLADKKKYNEWKREFDRELGLAHIQVWHLNDSKHPLGSGKDRHEDIGKGELGKEAFRHVLNDRDFSGLPMVLETDPGEDNQGHRRNLGVLRSLQ